MPITLAQAQNLSQSKLVQTVIDEFRKSALLDQMTVEGGAQPRLAGASACDWPRVASAGACPR